MKIYPLIFFLILFVQCGNILGEDDPSNFLEPENIIGEWVRVKEVPSDVAGLYRKDTTIYQIGLDKLTDYMKFVDKSLYDPLTFKIIYLKGGTLYGYLERPEDNYRAYDIEKQESSLNYNLYLGLPDITTMYRASFTVPNGYTADTLKVTINSEVFGLKRKGL
jgi:hypothetical protein